MNANELDRLFDDGAEVGEYIDWNSAERPNLKIQAVTVGLPVWIIRELDRRAEAMGVDRDALIKNWLVERLPQATSKPIAAE